MKQFIQLLNRVFNILKMSIVKSLEAKKKTNTQQSLPTQEQHVLTDQELEFILLKLRESNYKGYEFDMYARVYKKIAEHIKK